MTRTILIGLASLCGIALLGYLIYEGSQETLAFPGLSGPSVATELPLEAPPRTPPSTYYSDSTAGIGVLLQDSGGSWLGLAHGLKSMGVPFRVVDRIEEALEHDVILVYPSMTGSNTAAETLAALAQHVRSGNTLIAFSVFGGGMPAIFGFESTTERDDLLAIEFNEDFFEPDFFNGPVESTIPLSQESNPSPLAGVSYHELQQPAIAAYDDGSAAIVHNSFEGEDGVGHAYAIGFDFGHFILRAHNARFFRLAGSYVNDYQPKLDSFLRFLARVYREGDDDAVELLTVPHNKEFTALLTHDIDFNRSILNIPAYADYQFSQGVPATYFIQTKYITDYNDSRFFEPSSEAILGGIDAQGMEIASHSVAHSNEFQNMPAGSGTEAYPDYRPYVRDFETQIGGSIAGELRVSKFLLETLSPQAVVSFRPGHLSLPETLPEMLNATGYEFSSSITANTALTHLPYRATYARGYASELDVFEIPITIEDEIGRLGDRLDAAIEVANNIGRHGGVVNLLIHTDVLGHKMEFMRGFIEEFRDRAWFTTVGEFGQWWATRDGVGLELETIDEYSRRLILEAPHTIDGLGLRLPPSWRYQSGLDGSIQEGNILLLAEFSGRIELEFQLNSQ